MDRLVTALLADPLLGTRRHRVRWYVGCATGSEIVSWLTEEGGLPPPLVTAVQ